MGGCWVGQEGMLEVGRVEEVVEVRCTVAFMSKLHLGHLIGSKVGTYVFSRTLLGSHPFSIGGISGNGWCCCCAYR